MSQRSDELANRILQSALATIASAGGTVILDDPPRANEATIVLLVDEHLWWTGLADFDPVVEPPPGATVRWYEGSTCRIGTVVGRGPGFVRARHTLHRSGASQVDVVMNGRYVVIDPASGLEVAR